MFNDKIKFHGCQRVDAQVSRIISIVKHARLEGETDNA